MKFKDCPNCGIPLKQGYLLGKHNRIRWSVSREGMTIFHGVPLIKLKKQFWRDFKWWSFPPSIPAVKCSNCKLVIFEYDNDIIENPNKERIASTIIGGALTTAGIVLSILTVMLVIYIKEVHILLILSLGFISFIILLIGALFIAHVRRYPYENK